MTTSIPTTHSKYCRTGVFTGVEGGIVLKKDVPIPKPGRGQVLVQIHAVSLNYRDVVSLKGGYPSYVTPNGIPVSDGAGLVVELGESLTLFIKLYKFIVSL